MSVLYDLPPAADVAKSRNLPETDKSKGYTLKFIYSYSKSGDSFTFKNVPENAWSN